MTATDTLGSSLSRLATTSPEVPPPITMKSYSLAALGSAAGAASAAATSASPAMLRDMVMVLREEGVERLEDRTKESQDVLTLSPYIGHLPFQCLVPAKGDD